MSDYLILKEEDLVDGGCPVCGKVPTKMCSLDHNHCEHEIIDGTKTCPECGEFVCPKCGSHDVESVARITGYLSSLSGWNAGKRAEFKDRQRYDVAGAGL